MSNISNPPDPHPAAAQGTDRAGDPPAFEAPWQATAFALLIHLVEVGRLSWSEWNGAFSTELQNGSASGQEEYFTCWVEALQRLLVGMGILNASEILRLAEELHAQHDH